MSDYQYSFGEFRVRDFDPTHQYRERDKRHYKGSSSFLIGYIGTVSEQDIVTRRFNVHIPEYGNERVKAGLVAPLDQVSTQGVGTRGFAPETGTPVVLQFNKESNQLLIVGGLHLSGTDFGDIITDTNQLPAPDSPINSVWNAPINQTMMELGVEKSSIVVTPYLGRAENIVYDVPVADQIPGDFTIETKTGIRFKSFTNVDASVGPIILNKAQGAEMSVPDKAQDSLQKTYEDTKRDIKSYLDTEFIYESKKIIRSRVIRELRSIKESSSNTGLNNFIQKISNLINSSINLLQAANEFIEWRDNEQFLLDSLGELIGMFDFSFSSDIGGLVGINVNFSLTSINVNMSIRTGVGILDTIASSVINNLLNLVLSKFNILKLTGLEAIFETIFGEGVKISPKDTFTVNAMTKTLRVNSSVEQLIGSIKDVFNLDDPYLMPDISLRGYAINLSKPEGMLTKFILESGYLSGMELPYLLKDLFRKGDVLTFLKLCAHLLQSNADKIQFYFLYGYISKNRAETDLFFNSIFSNRVKGKLFSLYNWQILTKTQLINILEQEYSIVVPYDFDLISNPYSLLEYFEESANVYDGIEYLLAGQVSEYLNQVMINQCKVDYRTNFLRYVKLKELIQLSI